MDPITSRDVIIDLFVCAPNRLTHAKQSKMDFILLRMWYSAPELSHAMRYHAISITGEAVRLRRERLRSTRLKCRKVAQESGGKILTTYLTP